MIGIVKFETLLKKYSEKPILLVRNKDFFVVKLYKNIVICIPFNKNLLKERYTHIEFSQLNVYLHIYDDFDSLLDSYLKYNKSVE